MTPRIMTTPQQLDHALQYWKSFSFNNSYINLKDAVDSVATDAPIVEPRMEYSGRWMLCMADNKLGNQDAVFHTAAVWVWGSNLETGNYVPRGETAPSKGKVSESRMQDTPNAMCQFSYAVDTSHDKTIYDAQKVFEQQICKLADFNRTQKPRRKWQEGEGAYDATYIFVAQVFVRRGYYTWKKELMLSYELHPWIQDATASGKQYFANPNRPEVFEVVDGQLRSISECAPPGLMYGDVIWISFIVEFIVSSNAWHPNFVPVEIVRVGRVAPDLVLSKTASDAEPEPETCEAPTRRQRLQAGQPVRLAADFPMHDPSGTVPIRAAQPSGRKVLKPTNAGGAEKLVAPSVQSGGGGIPDAFRIQSTGHADHMATSSQPPAEENVALEGRLLETQRVAGGADNRTRTPDEMCPYELELMSPPYGNAIPLPDFVESPCADRGKQSAHSGLLLDAANQRVSPPHEGLPTSSQRGPGVALGRLQATPTTSSGHANVSARDAAPSVPIVRIRARPRVSANPPSFEPTPETHIPLQSENAPDLDPPPQPSTPVGAHTPQLSPLKRKRSRAVSKRSKRPATDTSVQSQSETSGRVLRSRPAGRGRP